MTDSSRTLNVLVLCTGNSCRSILAEVLFRELGAGRIDAYSAGSRPAGVINPGAIRKLQAEGHGVDGLESKSWDRYTDEPEFDIVITVCDSAAGESCPLWPGSPIRANWGIPDPADAEGDRAGPAFDLAYRQLCRRIEDTLELPLDSMDPRHLQDALNRIHDAANAAERLND